MTAKIKYLQYQRNGVKGEPFYHCLATIKDDKSREMLITFMTGVNDTQILWSSCRAVAINDLSTNWRGDVIASCLNDELDKQMKEKGGTIYDCCTKQDLYTV